MADTFRMEQEDEFDSSLATILLPPEPVRVGDHVILTVEKIWQSVVFRIHTTDTKIGVNLIPYTGTTVQVAMPLNDEAVWGDPEKEEFPNAITYAELEYLLKLQMRLQTSLENEKQRSIEQKAGF